MSIQLVVALISLIAVTVQAFVPNGVSLKGNPIGIHRILVMLLEWSDQVSKPKPPVADYDEMWNGKGVSTNIPAGSISNWTDVNSYGKLSIEGKVIDWYPTDNTESHYANGQQGIPYADNTVNIAAAFVPLLNHLDSQGFDFSQFDQNQDLVIDVVVFLHSGYSSELEGVDCNTGATANNRIHSFAASALGSSVDWFSPSTGYRLGSYVIASAFQGLCGSTIAKIGTITHEYMHTFGLPDLYDKEGKYNNNPALGGLAGFEIMANPGGQVNKFGFPGHTSPWCKMQLGWLNPIEITSDGTYTMRASELYPDVYKISAGFNASAGEFLLIENRQPLLFDINMWTGGPLIYHVDQSAGPGNNFRGFPGMTNPGGWPGNGRHYEVALLQADGLYRLEQSLSNGDAAMFWLTGETLGPGNGESVATSSGTYPNTDSYAGGIIKRTNIVLTNFKEVSPMVWSFDVQGLPPSAPSTPAPAPVGPTPHPVFAPVPLPGAPTLSPIVSAPASSPTSPNQAPSTASPTRAGLGPVSPTLAPSVTGPGGASPVGPNIFRSASPTRAGLGPVSPTLTPNGTSPGSASPVPPSVAQSASPTRVGQGPASPTLAPNATSPAGSAPVATSSSASPTKLRPLSPTLAPSAAKPGAATPVSTAPAAPATPTSNSPVLIPSATSPATVTNTSAPAAAPTISPANSSPATPTNPGSTGSPVSTSATPKPTTGSTASQSTNGSGGGASKTTLLVLGGCFTALGIAGALFAGFHLLSPAAKPAGGGPPKRRP